MSTVTCINFVFESELAKTKEVLCDVLSFMQNQFPYISDSDLFELRLVYSELLINSVIHGNKEDSSKKVELIIEVRNDTVFSVIRDEGDGFDYLKILELGDIHENFLSDHGRGILLVSSLTEFLDFNEPGNEIRFKKRIAG